MLIPYYTWLLVIFVLICINQGASAYSVLYMATSDLCINLYRSGCKCLFRIIHGYLVIFVLICINQGASAYSVLYMATCDLCINLYKSGCKCLFRIIHGYL